jgi:hypothetical protein
MAMNLSWQDRNFRIGDDGRIAPAGGGLSLFRTQSHLFSISFIEELAIRARMGLASPVRATIARMHFIRARAPWPMSNTSVPDVWR